MGWTYSYNWPTRKDLIKHLLVNEGSKYKAVRHCCVGNHLWVVFEATLEEKTVRNICLFKMQFHTKDYPYWGYKDIDESMGPNEVTCPLSYIDMCTEPTSEYSHEWREEVRAYHRLRSRKLNIDDEIILYGKTYRVCEDLGRKGYRMTLLPAQGLVYRLKPSQIHLIEILRKEKQP